MAEASLTFYLNREYVYCQYSAHDDRLQMGIDLKVNPELFRAKKLPKDQKAKLTRLSGLIDDYEANTRQAGRNTVKAEVQEIIQEAIGKKSVSRGGHTFSDYFAKYLSDVEDGIILNEGKKYSRSYIKTAKVVKGWLADLKLGKVSIDKIREEHLQEYASELTKEGLSKNTVATYLDPVISFLNNGRRLRRHKGQLLDSRSFRVNREDIDHAVYLNEDEMKAITALKYTGERAVWRDAFILGCWLGMRHSDLSRLTPTHRKGDVVNINTAKTGTPVWVPLSTDAKAIWDKHKGIFNIPALTPFMLFAKELGADAGLNDQILFSRTEGGEKVERWVPKYELMGTHTMRRSFATNAYKAGVPMPSIMKVTGHKSTRNFLKYIRLTEEEHAVILSQHSYFK